MRSMSFYALSYDKDFEKLIRERKDKGLKIHSIFKRVINLVDQEGKIYSILQGSLDNGPSALRLEVASKCNFQDLKLAVNDLVDIKETSLEIENKMIIFLGETKTWSQESLRIKVDDENIKQFKKNIKLYEDYLLEIGVDGGSKYYYIENFLNPNKSYKASLIEKVLSRRIKLFLSSLDENIEVLSVSILALIGLGNGLTPSGDDFIVGFITAIKSIESDRAKKIFKDIRLVLDKSSLATTDISQSMIENCTKGRVRERIINFTKELFKEGEKGFLDSTEKIFSIGYSSGLDLTVGIILGYRYGFHILENGGKVDEKHHS